MSTPPLSVIMPVYNAARFVGAAVESVLRQTFGDFEFLMIDDASTDGSRAVLAGITDPRCRLLFNETNLGAAETKNRGLAEARGELIAFLDCDDLALPERFAMQVDWLRVNPSVGVLGTSIEHIDAAGDSLGKFDLSEPDPRALRARFLFENRVAQSSVMLRRAALDDTAFRKEYEPAEDYDFWAHLAPKTNFAVMAPVLVRYRIHDRSVSALKVAAMQSAVVSIQGAQLGQLGISDTSNLQPVVVGTESISSLALLDALSQWLGALRKANHERGIYDSAIFDRELCSRWIAIGERARGLGLAGWKEWRRLAPVTGPSMTAIQMLGRALRWELARRVRHS
jgi:glycosyltransferase involved in cell wall biosynthesis